MGLFDLIGFAAQAYFNKPYGEEQQKEAEEAYNKMMAEMDRKENNKSGSTSSSQSVTPSVSVTPVSSSFSKKKEEVLGQRSSYSWASKSVKDENEVENMPPKEENKTEIKLSEEEKPESRGPVFDAFDEMNKHIDSLVDNLINAANSLICDDNDSAKIVTEEESKKAPVSVEIPAPPTNKVKKIPYAIKDRSQLDSSKFLLVNSTLYCISKSGGTHCKFDLSLLVPQASGMIPIDQTEKYSSSAKATEVAAPRKKFVCQVCGYVHESNGTEIETCPTCRAPFSKFIEMKPEKKVKSICPVCSYVNDINARFCPQCGAHMPH